MKKTTFFRLMVISMITSSMAFQANAQVKVGSNPTTISSNANLEVEATNASKTVITKDLGRLGVNTTSPTTTLDVNGNARVQTAAENSASIKTVKLDADGTLSFAYQVAAFPQMAGGPQDDVVGTTYPFSGTINGNAITYTLTSKGTNTYGYTAYYTVTIAGTGFGFTPKFIMVTPAPDYFGDFLVANVIGGTITATGFQMKIIRPSITTPWNAGPPLGILAIK